MITFAKHQLRAALTHAPSTEIRYYLNGVYLEFTEPGDIHIVATDGHRMFCGLIFAKDARWTDAPQKGPFSMIVPYAAIKAATKGNGGVTLSALPDGRYSLGDSIFTPIDGCFLDWRRFVPAVSGPDEPAQYNWQFIADAGTAIKAWYGSKRCIGVLRQHGFGPGLMLSPDGAAFCLIMPMHKDVVSADPFRPCPYESPKEA